MKLVHVCSKLAPEVNVNLRFLKQYPWFLVLERENNILLETVNSCIREKTSGGGLLNIYE